MHDDDIIAGWLKNVHGVDDDQFAQVVWQLYFQKLVELARSKLGSLPRRAEDEEDVAISAMGSFMRAAKDGRFPQLNDRDDLWRLLVTITLRKITARNRRFFSQKRGAGAVRGESELAGGEGGYPANFDDILGREPTQELASSMFETSGDLLERLNDPDLKTIALYKMESYTNDEIALLLRCSLRTVHRRLEKIREIWTRDLDNRD